MINYLDRIKLDGKTALVCGGLGLIGREISKALAQAGSKVVLLDIDENEGQRFVENCRNENLAVEFYKFDITKTESYHHDLSKIVEIHGDFQIMANAAYPRTQDWGNGFEDMLDSSFKKNVEMQLSCVCYFTTKVAEYMRKNGIAGSVINLGSIYGVVGPDFGVYEGLPMTCPPAYGAVKGGIASFGRHAASYYGKFGIRINTVSPGGVFNGQDPKFVARYERKTPLQRMAQADEVASMVAFLASSAASYVTGTEIMVDGGWTSI